MPTAERIKVDTCSMADMSGMDSSSMDNVPLKVLFPNVKSLHSPQEKERKVVLMDLASPKSPTDNADSVRLKLRESLASALALVADEHVDKDVKLENKTDSLGGSEDCTVKTEDCSNTNPAEIAAENGGLLSRPLKRGRDDVSDGGINKGDPVSTEADCASKQSAYENEAQEKETSSKRTKVEGYAKPVIGQKDNISQIMAVKIEAELFRKYGGVSKKYKEKARSLLFNLKDKNNPELRARVASGEISPECLCSMSPEQLASKELSQWRIAKAEELAHMIVIPESNGEVRRLVKKTHKGEYQVDFEIENNTAREAGSVSGQILNSEEQSDVMEQADVGEDTRPSEKVAELLPKKAASLKPRTHLNSEEKKSLPEIMSLDDYMGSKGELQNEQFETEATEIKNAHLGHFDEDAYLPNISDFPSGNENFFVSDLKYSSGVNEFQQRCSSLEKLWEGTLQLNPLAVQNVTAYFKSGEKTTADDWSPYIEVKGRVRLDAFEKFMQELPLSRSRAVMVALITYRDAYVDSGFANIKEVSESYRQTERVGFAEPAPGVELYLCPQDASILKILGQYISYEMFEEMNEMEALLGCIVWRRNNITFNVLPMAAEHNIKTSDSMNAKKLALSGHLMDSPTRPEEMHPVHLRSDAMDVSLEKHFVQGSLPVVKSSSKNASIVEDLSNGVQPPPGFDPKSSFNTAAAFSNDDDDDIPPGFGPEPLHKKVSIHRNLEEDDDLPEFDYDRETENYSLMKKLTQESHGVRSLSSYPSIQQAQVPIVTNKQYTHSNTTYPPPQFDYSSSHVAPLQPCPSQVPMQARDLINRFGQNEADVAFTSAPNNIALETQVNPGYANHFGNQNFNGNPEPPQHLKYPPIHYRGGNPRLQPQANPQLPPSQEFMSPMEHQRSQQMHMPFPMHGGPPMSRDLTFRPPAPMHFTGFSRPMQMMTNTGFSRPMQMMTKDCMFVQTNNSPPFWNGNNFRSDGRNMF